MKVIGLEDKEYNPETLFLVKVLRQSIYGSLRMFSTGLYIRTVGHHKVALFRRSQGTSKKGSYWGGL